MECKCSKTENTKVFQDLLPTIEHYKHIDGSLISVMQEAQELYGYLSMELIQFIAKEMNIKPANVLGVATFYTQFRLTPVGKNLITLCQGTACHVNGSVAIEEAITDELGIKDGETTEDGLFTLSNVACLGCCSLSPVMIISGETYGKLTPDLTKKILREIKANSKKAVKT